MGCPEDSKVDIVDREVCACSGTSNISISGFVDTLSNVADDADRHSISKLSSARR